MRFELSLSTAILLAWVAAPAAAQGTDAYAAAWAVAEHADPNAIICHDKSGDEAIAGCTAAIQSGKLSGIGLAIAFYGRGFEFQMQKNATRAIADFTEAIRINPQEAAAFNARGKALRRVGKAAEGDADIAKACSLDSAYCESKTR
jgi:tetratricopeptide (TPR) repeat protein